MRLSPFGTCLLSLVCGSAAFSACGSSDGKNKAQAYGGEGGVSDAGAPSAADAGAGLGGAAGNPAVNSAGEGGLRAEVGGAAGAGGAGSALPFHGLYIGTMGDDASAGTETAPFKTLEHAASVAGSGDTIVFLDGNFAMGSAPVTIAAGVDVMAQNAGQATLTGGGTTALFSLSGDTHISGLAFSGQQTVVQFEGAQNASGTVTVTDSSFGTCATSCLNLTGAAKAIVTTPDTAVLGNGGGAFALLSGTSSLSLSGGVLQNYGAAGIIRATDDATLDLSSFQVQDGTGMVLSLDKQATATIDGATIATLSQSLFKQLGTSELSVKNSDISIKPSANGLVCFDLEMDGVGKLTVDTTKVHGCGTGLKGSPPAELNLLGSEFYDLSFGGADLDNGAGEVGGTIVIDGCNFHDVVYTGMRIGSGTPTLKLTMRNTTINVSSLGGWDGLILNGGNTSLIDLGTLAKPGGNTFLQATATSTAVRLQMQAVTVQAVGNTWTPNAEGADAQGHYAVAAGKTLDVTAVTNTGINYIKPYGTTTVRLAQIP